MVFLLSPVAAKAAESSSDDEDEDVVVVEELDPELQALRSRRAAKQRGDVIAIDLSSSDEEESDNDSDAERKLMAASRKRRLNGASAVYLCATGPQYLRCLGPSHHGLGLPRSWG